MVWTNAYDRLAADPLAPRQVAVAASQVVRCGLWGASSYKRSMRDQGLSLYLQFCADYWGGSAEDEQILQAARRVTAAVVHAIFAIIMLDAVFALIYMELEL